MIVFKKLRYKNLLSTGNIFTEIDLNDTPNTLIVGENGSGKSTVIEAISFVLFNKPYRSINKPNLVNSITQKNLIVEVEFEVGNNKYKIVRGIKPNVFEIYLNEDLLNQSAEIKDYQEILEKQILRVNHKTFCQVVVLGTASFIPFMQLPAHLRREVVEDILDLKIFSLMNLVLKNRVQENDKSILDSGADLRVIKEKLEYIKQHNQRIIIENAKLVNEKQERIDETKKEIEFVLDRIAKLGDARTKLENKIEKKNLIHKKIASVNKQIATIESRIEKLNSDNHFFNHNDNCPTCKQVIDTKFKRNEIQINVNSIGELKDSCIVLKLELSKLEDTSERIRTIEEKSTVISVEINKKKNHVVGLERYILDMETDVSKLNDNNTNNQKDTILNLNLELKKIEAEYQTLLENKNTLGIVSAMLKDSGIKARIIKQYVPIINKLINKYLSMMDFFVNFSLNEKFEETILSRNRDNFSYSSFSEGEKFRINLAILFTWRAIAKLRNSINTNILFMDEVMDSSLDASGTEEFLKILSQFSNDTNVFVISHKVDQLYDKFERIIKFEKKNNFSKGSVL